MMSFVLKKSISTRLSSERGAMLLLIAVVILGILAVLVILGIDAVRVKKVAQELRLDADLLCELVAENPLVQQQAVDKAGAELTRLHAKYQGMGIELLTARVMIPTQPTQSISAVSGYSDYLTPSTCSQVDSSNPTEVSFDENTSTPPYLSGQGITIDTCPAAMDCKFYGDFCSLGNSSGLINIAFPSSLVSNLDGAGNVVGCTLKARVPSVMPFLYLGGARAMAPIANVMWRRPVRSPAPASPSTINDLTELPGLIIALSTHMKTTNCADDAPSTCTLDNKFNFTPQTPLSVTYEEDFRKKFDPLWTLNGFQRPAFAYGAPVAISPPYDLPTISSLSGNVKNQMLSACLNPAVLVRNAFLSTIVELASRSGQTRARTGILHANPVQSTVNPPAQIVRFGQDLTDTDLTGPAGFQLPFTVYENVTPTNNRLLASQLRICYSLYHGTATDLNNVPGIHRFEDAHFTNLLSNSQFEDSTMRYARPPSLFNGNSAYSASSDPWDQECPWGGCSNFIKTRPLRAAELVAALGTTQRCPVEGIGSNCTKFLLPDWDGVMQYLNGPPIGQDGALGPPVPNSIYQSPGWPTLASNASAPRNAHLLFVLHQLPTAPLAIPPGTFVTVAYFPTSEVTPDTLDQLRAYFGITDPAIDPNAATQRALFVFSPYDEKYSTEPYPEFSGTEYERYFQYWRYMLGQDENKSEHIVDAAANIFLNRILRYERKF